MRQQRADAVVRDAKKTSRTLQLLRSHSLAYSHASATSAAMTTPLPTPPPKRSRSIDASDSLLRLVTHPVILNKLTQMRRAETSSKHFRELLNEISLYLAFAATEDLELESCVVQSATGNALGMTLKSKIAIVPIMRSGLGMVDSVLTVTPHATVYHLGMYSNPESLVPVLYFNKLPVACNMNVALVLEPQVGTGATLIATLDLVKEWGAGKLKSIKVISIVASREGMERVRSAHPDVSFHMVAIDDGLEGALPIPGIGDVGSRLFNA